ncbi:unnamed protein product [Penicillium salamii]|uniref:Rhodopsin domain-containing protein n=1 Tax=Penicillium salamii TaxID=1612424 RepID=A0A9W4J2I2_9EURO|nr:unnamed protein product [Penicillium salamii]CAG8003275.1 unnamed protein product [Penicillium salamii]CAG8051928.1 unnamed protein product [Penicillium salamii]CAG8199951.1 unnamed protein product [Penicillium salamii]CAG8220248.1 unnamed protein product [Penicillium salamii]
MPWVHNLQDSDSHHGIRRVITICVVLPTIALLAVCLRLGIRMNRKRTLWVDDYAALISVLLTWTYAGISLAQTRWGLGLKMDHFPRENVVAFSKVQWMGGPVYTLNLLAFKVSLLASYHRIGGFVALYRTIIVIAIAICVVTQLIYTFIICLACQPVRPLLLNVNQYRILSLVFWGAKLKQIQIARQWDMSVEGKCIDTVSFYYGTNLAFDIAIFILPMPVLWKLQLRQKEKVVLTGLFALGFFVTIIQIARIFQVKNLKVVTDSEKLIIWSIIEVSLGVCHFHSTRLDQILTFKTSIQAIITCIPTFGPLFKSFARTVSSHRHNGTGPSYPLNSMTGGVFQSKNSGNTSAIFGSRTENTGTTVHSGTEGVQLSHGTGSQEHILGGEERTGIYRTVDFTVEKN